MASRPETETDAAPGTNSSVNSFEELCTKVNGLVPEAVGSETWYLIIATVLTSSPNPTLLGAFYNHLTATSGDTRFHAPNNQPLLSLRLRDMLVKLVTLIGAPPVVVAVSALATAEAGAKGRAAVDDQSERSVLSEKWKDYTIPSVQRRGQKTIRSIYGSLLPEIFKGFGSHREDIVHLETAHVYGLYLSDHSVLTAPESEVVVLSAILCTGLRSPGLWHVRGLGRLLGARGEDASNEVKDVLRGVKMAIMSCVEWCGTEMEGRVRLSEWPNVGDVARELGGWGDDVFEEVSGEDEVTEEGHDEDKGRAKKVASGEA